MVWAWALFLFTRRSTSFWVDGATRVMSGPGWDPAVVHRIALVRSWCSTCSSSTSVAARCWSGQLVRPRAVVGFDPRVDPPTTGSPARVGEAIGVLERLLIVTFVLTGAEAAVGFVIAAKTLARFKQLDDRGFAEYYLLGTLASVSVAIASALLARAVLV